MAKWLVTKLALVAVVTLCVFLVTAPAHADELEDLLNEFDEDDEFYLTYIENNHATHETEHGAEEETEDNEDDYDPDDYDPDDYSSEEEHQPETVVVTPDSLTSFDPNPCRTERCGVGSVCQINAITQRGECVCLTECPAETNPRYHVCTNRNETLNSSCDIFRKSCLCARDVNACEEERIHYHGSCRQILECRQEEFVDYPRRMREWLLSLLMNRVTRNELPPEYLVLSGERLDIEQSWRNAAVWKWCELDVFPRDLFLSWNELFPIRAHLLAHEDCIVPFLQHCDWNGDEHITLEEWGICLELGKEELKARCPQTPDDDEDPHLADLYGSYV